jgi:hypothetical protein
MVWASDVLGKRCMGEKLYSARDGFVPERNEIYSCERGKLYRRWRTRAFEPPAREVGVGPVRTPDAEPLLHRTDNPGVGHHHYVAAKCKFAEASHRCLDALVEGAQLLPAWESTQAPLAPQLDFAWPASGYLGHREAVPFTDVVFAQGRFEGNRPRVTDLLGDQFGGDPSASQVGTGNLVRLQSLSREVLARPRGLFYPRLGKWGVRPALPAAGCVPDRLSMADKE